MQKPMLLLPTLLVMVYLPQANSQKPSHKPAEAEKPPATIQVEPPRPEVKQIYKFDCAVCHGESGNGQGDIGKTMNLLDWTNPSTLASKTDQQLIEAIRKGSDKMPPEDAARAKDDEVKGLVKMIRSFSKNQPAAAPTAQPAAEPAPAQAPAAQSSSPTGK